MLLLLPAPPILPTDPRIVTIGRFDRADPAAIACEWSASEVRLRASGDVLVATIEDSGRNYLQVLVDGKPTATIALRPGVDEYTVWLGTEGVHDVSLVRRTEAFLGVTRFRGFDVPGGGLFQARRRQKTVEFIGDSITAAFGNEGTNEKEQFRPETENATLGYAYLTARALDAEARLLAWSGRKMAPDNAMPEVYDRILPTQPTPLVGADEPAPDAVVINLATNDFAPDNPEEASWTADYEAFVRRVWAKYPDVPIYVALGSMMTDTHPKGHLALSTARGYLTRMVARIHDPRLRFIEFPAQTAADGYGSAWHPNLGTHRRMATKLAETMRKDLGW